MRRRPPPSYYKVEELVTLDISKEAAALGELSAPKESPAPKEGAPPKDVATPRKSAGRVLLLEDRDDFREVVRDHLDSCSYEVTSVPSGVEGLREIMKREFDIILCDMMMPEVGGEMFYWAVTRVQSAAARRFIFFTGHQNNPAIEFFFRRVNAAVLIKPFALKALDSAIDGLLLQLRREAHKRRSPLPRV